MKILKEETCGVGAVRRGAAHCRCCGTYPVLRLLPQHASRPFRRRRLLAAADTAAPRPNPPSVQQHRRSFGLICPAPALGPQPHWTQRTPLSHKHIQHALPAAAPLPQCTPPTSRPATSRNRIFSTTPRHPTSLAVPHSAPAPPTPTPHPPAAPPWPAAPPPRHLSFTPHPPLPPSPQLDSLGNPPPSAETVSSLPCHAIPPHAVNSSIPPQPPPLLATSRSAPLPPIATG